MSLPEERRRPIPTLGTPRSTDAPKSTGTPSGTGTPRDAGTPRARDQVASSSTIAGTPGRAPASEMRSSAVSSFFMPGSGTSQAAEVRPKTPRRTSHASQSGEGGAGTPRRLSRMSQASEGGTRSPRRLSRPSQASEGGARTPRRTSHASQSSDGGARTPRQLSRMSQASEGGTRSPRRLSRPSQASEESARSPRRVSRWSHATEGGARSPRMLSRPSKANAGNFPPIDERSDRNIGSNTGQGIESGAVDTTLGSLIEKVPQSIWQANAVVPRHRRKAHLYWALLLIGYGVYIILAINNSLERRRNPPVQLTRINEAFQLPDVGFCFEGDTYGSRFACFDGDANGEDCANSYQADAFVYGYNYTGYTTPDGYDDTDEYIVLLPDSLSSTCKRFRFSTLTATEGNAWRFHMLMFWDSQYNATLLPGAFQSIKMYLYDGRLTAEELVDTPITLYAPMSFDPSEVPFVRGFLEYEQRISLDESVDHQYTVVDTTQSPWHNAEDAVSLAADYGTDSLASIQLDIRKQTYLLYEEVDPLDVVGTLGEISGFWLVVPLMFGLLFYRRSDDDGGDKAEMRTFKGCGSSTNQPQQVEPRTDFSGRIARW